MPAVQETAYYIVDLGSSPGLERSPGGGNGNPLQYSCRGHPMDRGAWQGIVHGIQRIRHDLATKPPPNVYFRKEEFKINELINLRKSKTSKVCPKKEERKGEDK